MEIREYNKNDITSINSLGNILHNSYNLNLDNFSNCLVILKDNNAIGFITYSIIYERAEIIDIIIDKKYRNNNLGSMLLDEVIQIIKQKDCNNITLEVSSNNIPAIKLYEKFNFKVASVRKKYYKNSDAYLMKKDLR